MTSQVSSAGSRDRKKRKRSPTREKILKIIPHAQAADREGDCVGLDQGRLATEDCLKIATKLLGGPPAFWGRYIKGPGNNMPIQYQANQEGPFFAKHHIPILPIARQTENVSKEDVDLGYCDGLRNAAALISAFGAINLCKMPAVAIFLDVEPDASLDPEYYLGWSAGVVQAGEKVMIDFSDEVRAGGVPPDAKIRFAPGVYAHHSDDKTWKAIATALDRGAACEAAWVVYMDRIPNFPIGPWKKVFTSAFIPSSVRVVLCQRWLDYVDSHKRQYDFDLACPTYRDWLLPRLVLPTVSSL